MIEDSQLEVKKSRSLFQNPLVLGCLSAFVLVSIFLVGIAVGFGALRMTGTPSNSIFDDVISSGSSGDLQGDFSLFWEAMDLLYGDFYGDIPPTNEATHGAIRGVLNLLDDPNTSFMDPSEAEFFSTNIRGNFEGIGARVTWDEVADTLRITEPFEQQPAWKAGLRRDDLVLAVDGINLMGESNLLDAIEMIRGEKGTVVVLTIIREGADEPYDVEVTRDRIEIPTIATDRHGEDEQIAYIRLNTFNENAGDLVRQALEEALDEGAESLIFDLRGNSGGLLRESIRICSLFMEDQIAVVERFSDGREEVYETSGSAPGKEIPMVVLVNQGSASASEIVAGAVQDAERGLLIGSPTYGKGSVQMPHRLTDGSIMRVTIARWFTPLGRTIDGTGLTPDMEIELTMEQFEQDVDPQLDAAIEYLEK